MSDRDTCTWTQTGDEYDFWETSCDHAFVINEGTPKENGMRFCCYCGKRLEAVPYTISEAADEDETGPPNPEIGSALLKGTP
jgi:hypothetical protein